MSTHKGRVCINGLSHIATNQIAVLKGHMVDIIFSNESCLLVYINLASYSLTSSWLTLITTASSKHQAPQ